MSSTGPDQIRDFIQEAQGYMDGADTIRTLVDSGDLKKISDAINICIDNIKRGNNYARKYSFFILGQIGEEVALEVLEIAVTHERTSGLIGAAKAAIDAIKEAPRSKGFGEQERREIIENSYWRYNNPKEAMIKELGIRTNEPTKRPSGCFIATAVCGSPLAEEVIWLSRSRDEVLSRHSAGRLFIQIYYSISPKIASIISNKSILCSIIRTILIRPISLIVRNCLLKQITGN
jgi:hypothetical protein